VSEVRCTGVADDEAEIGATALRVTLGKRLRALREARALSPEQAGAAVGLSHWLIRRLELGCADLSEPRLYDLLALYGVSDATDRRAFRALARRHHGPLWWRRDGDNGVRPVGTYLTLEHAARLIRCYEPRVVPELLQTADYARALFRVAHPQDSTEEIERRVRARIRRQSRLISARPPTVWAVVEEAALRRPVGGPRVWQAQLDHLERAAEEPHITVQVLRDHALGPAVSGGAFTILRFAEAELPDVVYLSQLTGEYCVDSPRDLDAYKEAWDRLSMRAAPPQHLTQLVAALRAQYAPAFY
jgi:hypothetical protein